MRDIAVYNLGELLVVFDTLMEKFVDNDKISESQLMGTMVTICRGDRNELMMSVHVPRK